MSNELVEWLNGLGLQQYEQVLKANEFETLEDVASLTVEDLIDMGITKIGARRKFISAIDALIKAGFCIERNSHYQQLACKIVKERINGNGDNKLSHSKGNTKMFVNYGLLQNPKEKDGWVREFLETKSVLSPVLSTHSRSPMTNQRDMDNKFITTNDVSFQTCIPQECPQFLPLNTKVEQMQNSTNFNALKTMLHSKPNEPLKYLEYLGAASGFQSVKYPLSESSSKGLKIIFDIVNTGNEDMKGIKTLMKVSDLPSRDSIMSIEERFLDGPTGEIISSVLNENTDWEDVVNEASYLLYDQPMIPKDPQTGKPSEAPLLPMSVADVRKNMEMRVEKMQRPRPSSGLWPPTVDKVDIEKVKKKPDYQKILSEQYRHLRGMDIAHKLYQRLVEKALEAWSKNDTTNVMSVTKDLTEIKLKRQLQKHIKMLPFDAPDIVDENGEAFNAIPEKSEVDEKRKNVLVQIENEIRQLTKIIDKNGDGILQTEELCKAVDKNDELRANLDTLAVNLILSPEYRKMTTDLEYNTTVQLQLDEIAKEVDINRDGFLCKEELLKMNEDTKRRLSQMGVEIKFLNDKDQKAQEVA